MKVRLALNVYDFDGTIYKGDSSVDFYLYALKNRPVLARYAPIQALGFFLYGLKLINKTKMKEHFFSFLSGVDGKILVEEFWEHNYYKIHKWYLDLQQTEDIIISASPEFLLLPICQRLGIRHLIASRVDVQSGSFLGENCYGNEKVRRLFTEYHVSHIDNFYSDSQSDLPLAQISDNAFLVVNGNITNWNS